MKERYDELAFYTLQHPDQIYFIRKHVVDAYTAQLTDATTKPIALTFSLVAFICLLKRN